MKREHSRIESAISRLQSLHDGDRGVVDVVACGPQAIPALRRLLFEREPSGLYGARCRAVEALAALGGCGVLIEFLETERSSADSIERLGEDAVINAAALALARAHDRHAFDLLLGLARRPALTGIIGALGSFQRIEAIPALISALEEDASRLTAESALKKLGRSARTALLQTTNLRLPSGAHESESSARRRRSALRLLREVGTKRSDWAALRARSAVRYRCKSHRAGLQNLSRKSVSRRATGGRFCAHRATGSRRLDTKRRHRKNFGRSFLEHAGGDRTTPERAVAF